MAKSGIERFFVINEERSSILHADRVTRPDGKRLENGGEAERVANTKDGGHAGRVTQPGWSREKVAILVGKTWLMREFARMHYENVVYVRFDKDKLLRHIFDSDFDVERIL